MKRPNGAFPAPRVPAGGPRPPPASDPIPRGTRSPPPRGVPRGHPRARGGGQHLRTSQRGRRPARFYPVCRRGPSAAPGRPCRPARPPQAAQDGGGAGAARGLPAALAGPAAGLLGRAGQRAGVPGGGGPVDPLPQVERLLRERDELQHEDAQLQRAGALLRRRGLLRLPGAHPHPGRAAAAQLLHLLRRARHPALRHGGQRQPLARRRHPPPLQEHHPDHRPGRGQVGGGEVQAAGHDCLQRPLLRGAAAGAAVGDAKADTLLRQGPGALQGLDNGRPGQLHAGVAGGEPGGAAGRRAEPPVRQGGRLPQRGRLLGAQRPGRLRLLPNGLSGEGLQRR